MSNGKKVAGQACIKVEACIQYCNTLNKTGQKKNGLGCITKLRFTDNQYYAVRSKTDLTLNEHITDIYITCQGNI